MSVGLGVWVQIVLLLLIGFAFRCQPGQRLRGGQSRDGPPPFGREEMASDLELFACCLRSGSSLAEASLAVAEVSAWPVWRHTAALLALGVPAKRAWQPVLAFAELEDLATLTTTSEASGASLVKGLCRLSEQLREQDRHDALARSERAGVLIALPLTMCFLPAFLLLGLVPVIMSLGLEVFHF